MDRPVRCSTIRVGFDGPGADIGLSSIEITMIIHFVDTFLTELVAIHSYSPSFSERLHL